MHICIDCFNLEIKKLSYLNNFSYLTAKELCNILFLFLMREILLILVYFVLTKICLCDIRNCRYFTFINVREPDNS